MPRYESREDRATKPRRQRERGLRRQSREERERERVEKTKPRRERERERERERVGKTLTNCWLVSVRWERQTRNKNITLLVPLWLFSLPSLLLTNNNISI